MSAGSKRKSKCLTPECKRPPKTRGLCEACYQIARQRVIAGEVSWEQLIEAGLILARHDRSNARSPIARAIAALPPSAAQQSAVKLVDQMIALVE